MNNLDIYPVTDQRLSEYYGFTQSEVESLAKYYNLEDKLDEMKNGMTDIFSEKRKYIIHGV